MSTALKQLRIASIQSDLAWEKPETNRSNFKKKIEKAAQEADLVILPEMFNTGFSMNTALAEPYPGPTLLWLQNEAAKNGVALCGSVMTEDSGKFYNRLLFVEPSGKIYHYDKKHLFTLAGEHNHYTAGKTRIVIDYKGWKICPLICYDLRFPVWCRNTENYDLLIFTANWPARRSAQWEMLLRARAIENQCFVAGCNRWGHDGNEVYHDGRSLLADYLGETLDYARDEEKILRASLDLDELKEFRMRLAFLQDRDEFTLNQ